MTLDTAGAVIMLGSGGTTAQEQLVLSAQRAAAIDLIHLLQAHGIESVVVAAPALNWLPADMDVIREVDPPDRPFHFGERLAALIDQYALSPALYFGGGSAPLMDAMVMGMMVGMLMRAGAGPGAAVPSHIVLTNNLHSSDWAAISHVDAALPILRQCDRDNSIAWLLKESGEYDVRVLASVRPATSMDIDTPSDLALIAAHADVRPALRQVVSDPALADVPVERVIDVLRREQTTVALIGRVSPLGWQALNKVTRCWTRVIAEERGMVASGRLESGAVRSVLVPWIRARGFSGFFDDLADMADAVVFDDRVLFAASGVHPSAADRYASDLLRGHAVENTFVRDFTEAARHARLPVVLGGHSLVAGGLYVLAEIIEQRRRASGG